MTANRLPGRSAHPLIGIGAALLGSGLGIALVAWSGMSDPSLVAQAQGSGSCQQQEQACMQQGNSHGACHPIWLRCMQKCTVTGTGAGQCNQDPECQSACTESATSQGGKISCCEAGPQHGNTCRDKVDGKCNPQKTDLGKDMPMMPPMLPMLPMPMPKPDMPKPPQTEDCTIDPKPETCKESGVSNGILDGFKDLFGASNSGSADAGESQSVTDRLKSFLGLGGEAAQDTAAVQNPTEAVVTPVVPSGGTGSIAPSGGNGAGSAAAEGSGGTNQTITGFGGTGAANADTSTGPILSAMKNVISRIGSLLSSWF